MADPVLPYFIAGEENRLAGFVCRSDPSFLRETYPILLVGPSGAGKTALALHLAVKLSLSLGIESGATWQGYFVAADFARQYADAVNADDLDPLRRQLDEADVLVIDDLHGIAEKHAAQEELAIRISVRDAARRPTILTCRRLPSDIRGLKPALVSRSLPGLTISVRPPSPSTRLLILHELALALSLSIDDDLLQLLSLGLPNDVSVRQLHATMKQLALVCRMNDAPPSSLTIQTVLDTLQPENAVSVTDITRLVARAFRLRAADLRSDSRRQNVVRARSLAMLLTRKITSLSLNQIGAQFGGRDHTTVLHAIRKTESLLEIDADLRRAAEEVSEKLSG